MKFSKRQLKNVRYLASLTLQRSIGWNDDELWQIEVAGVEVLEWGGN